MRLLTDRLRALWAELRIPSEPTESDWMWIVTALSHVMLGAFLAVFLPAWIVVVAYAILKEFGDYWYRDGSWKDGTVDCIFVAIGTLYGPEFWPLMVWAAVTAGVVIRALNTPLNTPRKEL